MSKYDKAGLVQIPSGYNAGTLYSVVPTNSNGDFDFSRASTATRVNKDGLIETVGSDVPRLNYPMIDGVVSGCPSLLLEPSRTNIGLYSEEFDNSYWTKSNLSVSANDSVSPDGSENADKITENTSNAAHTITRFANIPAGTYTLSVFFKYAGKRYVGLGSASGATATAIFDLQEGVIVRATEGVVIGSQMQYYGNGWYRCVVLISSGLLSSGIFLLDDSLNRSYTGDGTSSIYIWGLQLEQGSYPTSYIPTQGSIVTRSAETCTGAGTSDTFNDSEGVLMAEISALDLSDTSSRRLGITKNLTFEGVRLQLGDGDISATVYDGTTNQYSKSVNIDNSIFHKVALKYKTNDFALWIDGIEYHPQSSGSTFVNGTLDDISFDYVNSNFFFAKTKQLQYFDTALTDSELEELTSWTSFNEMAQGQGYSLY